MDFRRILLRKPVSDIVASGESSQQRLAKVLGPFSIAAMGIGAIIGAGIFVLTGTAAALYAGPAIVLSFVLTAIACGLVGRPLKVEVALLSSIGADDEAKLDALKYLGHWVGDCPSAAPCLFRG